MLKEKWLITYSSVYFKITPMISDYKETIIYEGTLQSFLDVNTTKDEKGRRLSTVVIYLAVNL